MWYTPSASNALQPSRKVVEGWWMVHSALFYRVRDRKSQGTGRQNIVPAILVMVVYDQYNSDKLGNSCSPDDEQRSAPSDQIRWPEQQETGLLPSAAESWRLPAATQGSVGIVQKSWDNTNHFLLGKSVTREPQRSKELTRKRGLHLQWMASWSSPR